MPAPDLAVEYARQHYGERARRYASPLALGQALDPGTGRSPALDHIDAALVELMDDGGAYNALAVFIAAQEGKSTLCSRRLPEWVLEDDPAAQVAIVSYQADIAVRWGREIKRDVQLAGARLGISIRQDSASAARWDTPQGGGVYCVGVGGAFTGRSVNRLMVIDDPVKDRAEAESDTVRDSTWEWYESVALTRLGPRTRVVLVMTRFHEDDLAGRIFSRPGPLRWRQVSIPAIAEDAADPLGRAPGEAMASVRGRGPGYFHNQRAGLSPYVFSSMYQQRPTAAEGNMFRRAAFRYWRRAVAQPGAVYAGQWLDLEGRQFDLGDPAVWRFATIDVAASTRTAADWTVCSVWAITREGDLVLLDRARAQVEMADHFAMVKPLRDRWRFDVCYVERQFYSKTLVTDAQTAGIPVAELTADTDKITRAIPAAGRVHAGKAWFPADAPWLDEWCDELASFPKGTHDDQVDTLSYAARIAAAHWLPAAPPAPVRAETGLEAYEQAYAAATGHDRPPDLMTMPLG